MLFFATVSPSGELQYDRPGLLEDLLKGRLANCRVQVEIDRKKTPRSQAQSAYLFAAVYPPIAEHTGYSVPEVHEVCKQMFLPPRILTIRHQSVTVSGSTARLTTGEMVEYIDRCIALATELGCRIMSPEEAGYISNYQSPVAGYENSKRGNAGTEGL